MYAYRDPALDRLHEDVARSIHEESVDAASIRERLFDVASTNCPFTRDYWRRTTRGRGLPDDAFKRQRLYLFPDHEPVRVFCTSGTTGEARGRAAYSARGLDLMRTSILHNARRSIVHDLDKPVIVRLVPSEQDAPEMVMAYGMQQIAEAFGDPELSACVVSPSGFDFARLESALDAASAAGKPAILIGGSFAFVNLCDRLEAEGKSWRLPAGSRVVDAGGFKTRSRHVDVDTLREGLQRCFGVAASHCTNLFGMTELASQLYDASDRPLGPLRERPKRSLAFVEPRVLHPATLAPSASGIGLLEVIDHAVIDRPCAVLTGDYGIACEDGVAITGRIQKGQSRGCSLTLDSITRSEPTHA